MAKAYSPISSENLRRTLFLYLAVILFIFSVFLILTIASPIYERLKKSENNNVYHDVELRAMAVNEWARRAMDVAIQVTSRTRIRQELEKYNNKKISLTQLKAFTEPKLSDAMNISLEIIGITRLDSLGKIVAQCGESIPLLTHSIDYAAPFETSISTPVLQNGRHVVVVSAPIMNRSKEYTGSDLVLIELHQLENIIARKTESGKSFETILGYSSAGAVSKFFSEIKKTRRDTVNALLAKAFSGQAGMDDGSAVFVAAYHYLNIKNWGLVILKNKTELYKTLNTRLAYWGLTGVFAYILFLTGFWFLMKPLANRLLLHSDELSEKIKEQTQHLEEEIKERKRTAAELEKIITENRQAEIALSESEARLSHIIMGSPVPTFVIDNDHVTTHWNTALERVSGIFKNQVVGTKNQWMAFYSKERPVMADLIVDKVSKEKVSEYYSGKYKKSQSVENAYEAEDFFPEMGEHGRWLFFTAAPLLNSSGDTIGAVETLQDTSARKEAEKALKESERNYRFLADNVTDVIWSLDMDLRLNYISPSVEKLCGYSPEEALKMPLEQTFTPASYRKIIETFSKEISRDAEPGMLTNRSVVQELDMIRKDGEIIPVEVNASFLKDKSGSSTGIVGITREISNRKKAERALKESESKFRSIFDNKGTATCLFAEDSIIRECNLVFEKLSGYLKPDIINKMKWSDFFVKEDVKNMEKYHIQRSKKISSPPSQYECRFINKKGEVKTVIINVSLVGKQRIVSLTDITERKLAEAENQKLQEILAQSQKMEAMGSLAGGIAHDFNNILGAVLGFAELVKQDLKPGSNSFANMEQVVNAGIRAKKLVHQILLFSRQSEQEVKPIQPHLIIKEALKLLRSSIPATIEIKQNVPAGLGTIIADPTNVHQIVMNLCTNAYHAMRETGGTLAITLSKIDIQKTDVTFARLDLAPGTYLMLEVSDTGHGMNQEILKKIFNPYFTTKPKGEGSGLGLSVVHGIVKNCNGHIKVYSEPGQGTNIRIYFPRVETPDIAVGDYLEAKLQTGNEHILVVDDDPSVLEMMRLSLQDLGYRVTSFSNGHEALKAFRTRPDLFDLIITDMTMPKMTGLELSEELLKTKFDLPIIICTGYSELISKERAKALGIKGFLLKPVLRKDVSETIRKVLDY